METVISSFPLKISSPLPMIAALDIGSDKICCLIARRHEDNSIKLEGLGHYVSRGVKSGLITDLEATEIALMNAVNAAERNAGIAVKEIAISVNGGRPACHRIKIGMDLSGRTIEDHDVRQLLQRSTRGEDNGLDTRDIVHGFPEAFSVDDVDGIQDPCGMKGSYLGAHLRLITVAEGWLRHRLAVADRCHLGVSIAALAPVAAGLACLTEDECALGTTIIDMGAGTTSFATFAEGRPVFAGAILVGGHHITRDIARGIGTSVTTAERLKTLHGGVTSSLMDERLSMSIPASPETEIAESTKISRARLISIIRPRVEEILEMLRDRLKTSDHQATHTGHIVLTGGASLMPGLRELSVDILGRPTRIGQCLLEAYKFSGLGQAVAGPEYAVCVGLIRQALLHQDDYLLSLPRDRSFLGKIGKWLAENF